MEQYSIYELLWYTSITVIDIGYHTCKIRCRSGRPLLGHFREGSRKVQKIGVGRYQQFHPVILAPAVLYDIDYYYWCWMPYQQLKLQLWMPTARKLPGRFQESSEIWYIGFSVILWWNSIAYMRSYGISRLLWLILEDDRYYNSGWRCLGTSGKVPGKFWNLIFGFSFTFFTSV